MSVQTDLAIQHIPWTCTLDCGSRCELIACMRGDQLVRIDTPSDRPDTIERPRLIPCLRGRAQGRVRAAPSRVLHPLRRTGPRGSGEFEVISWDDALDLVAECLEAARQQYGPTSVLHAAGAGSISGRGFNGAAASRRFFSYWGPVTETSGNMSNHSASIAARWMLGESVPGSDRATLLDARLILLWGMNPAETHMGPNTAHFIAGARERGARVVLIDPRYTDSGVLADQWVPIRPGSDAALAAAMAWVMECEGLVDRAFLASHTCGYEAYRAYLLGEPDGQPKTPAWAEAQTGVEAAIIVELARLYGTVKPAALLPGWGPQRTLCGEQTARALIALACISGNVGLCGGGEAGVGTRSNVVPVGELPPGPYAPARRLPAGTWAQAILGGRLQPPIRVAYIVASNLINRSPDTRANARALEGIGFVVVHEPFLTPTARCADLVLPICTDLERADLVTSWGHDLHLFDSRQALPPAGQARTDYGVLASLAGRLNLGQAYTQGRSEAEWLALLRQDSPLGDQSLCRTDGEPRVALADFRADPAAHPLRTPSGKIEFVCPQAADYGLPLVPGYVEPPDSTPADDSLRLITPHSKLRSNSCLHDTTCLQRLEPHAAWINPQDAAARGIVDGERVEVYNERGAIRLPAYVTQRIMPGVICVYQGTWYRPGADGVDDGACANVLTAHQLSPTGGYATHSTWVQVKRSCP